jgi:acid stress chaperone HdeB
MKISKALYVLVFACFAQTASAQVLDLGTVKCKDWQASGRANIGLTLAWLDGYYQDEKAPSVIDLDKLKSNGAKLGEYCTKNPDIGLGTAAEELFGQ